MSLKTLENKLRSKKQPTKEELKELLIKDSETQNSFQEAGDLVLRNARLTMTEQNKGKLFQN